MAGHLDAQLAEYGDTLNTRLTQTKVLGLINQHIEDNAIVVGAAGSLPGDLQRIWQVKTPDSYHRNTATPVWAMKLRLLLEVVAGEATAAGLCHGGDGSYMMLHSELQTAVQEGIKVTILLFDNASFGCINNLQMGHGMGSFGTENRHRNPQTGRLDGPLVKVDFAKTRKATAVGHGAYMTSKACWRRWKPPCAFGACAAGYQSSAENHDPRLCLRWRTGDAQVADSPSVRKAAEQTFEQVKNARQY